MHAVFYYTTEDFKFQILFQYDYKIYDLLTDGAWLADKKVGNINKNV